MNTYEKIKAICVDRHIPIYQLEKEAGIGNGVIEGWKKASPRVSTLQKVAEALSVSIADLIG